MNIVIKISIFVGTSLALSHNMVYARPMQPSSTLAAYHNKVVNMYDVDEHNNQHAMVMSFVHHPVCIYTPLSYQDSLVTSLQKTYFLPKTRLSDFQKDVKYRNLCQSLQKLGIVLQIDEITGVHYGLQINFIMPSYDQYDITNKIDHDQKIVRFDIVKKI